MNWLLIKEDTFWKEEVTYSEPYFLRGVYFSGTETTTYDTFFATVEPYQDGQEVFMLPAGSSSTDARVLFTSEPLLTYDDTGDVTLSDKVFLSDPEVGKTPPQRFVVMRREDWSINTGFKLIDTGNAHCYLIIKEEKVVNNA